MGSSSVTGDETILFADNLSFDGTKRSGRLTQDAEVFLGAANAPHIRKSTLVSGDGSLTLSFSEPTSTTGQLDVRATNQAPSPISSTQSIAFEDFIGNAVSMSLVSAPPKNKYFTRFRKIIPASGDVTSETATASAGSTNPGQWRLQTGTETDGFAAIYSNISTICGNGSVVYETLIYIPTLSSSTQRYTLLVGMQSYFSVSPESGLYFRYSDNLNSGRWQMRAVNNGTASTANSTTEVVAGSWLKLRIEVNAAGTSSSFFVNGTEISGSPVTTNIPTVGPCWAFMEIRKSIGSTSRSVFVDYVYQDLNLSSPR